MTQVAKPFVPVRFAVLTVSDTRSLDEDRSGSTLAERITGAGHVLADRAIVTDDAKKIRGDRQALDRRSRHRRRSSPPAAPASPAAT